MKIPDNYDLWLAYEREQERRRADEEDDDFYFEDEEEDYERDCAWLDKLDREDKKIGKE